MRNDARAQLLAAFPRFFGKSGRGRMERRRRRDLDATWRRATNPVVAANKIGSRGEWEKSPVA